MSRNTQPKIRYSVTKEDLRERGVFVEQRSLPLPNVADFMGYIFKGMVVWLLYIFMASLIGSSNDVTGPITGQSDGMNGRRSARDSKLHSVPRVSVLDEIDQVRRNPREAGEQSLERLNESIGQAADGVASTLREFIDDPTRGD